MPKVLAVIPARYGSTRLPGKPLRAIGGKPMVCRVYEGAAASGVVDAVVVATDDPRIAEAVVAAGGRAVMTRLDHPSGTDRVAEVAASSDAAIVVNVQGDLPFVGRALLEPIVAPMLADPAVVMATLAVPITDERRFLDRNVVKVVTDEAGFALYFSRAPIPAWRDGENGGTEAVLGWQHVGIYGYRREFLLRFASWRPTELERREKLEQLRALERGVRVHVARVDGSVIEVDTPEDLERADREHRALRALERGEDR
jgi:3-deoxy-manno-octulosonate cytidylyltransferase (CMP-KDO synthetase)